MATRLGVDRLVQGERVAALNYDPMADRPVGETFRLLALNMNRMIGAEPRRSIEVASAFPGDGRSLVASSLARALAELAPPVLLVDADPAGAGLSAFEGGELSSRSEPNGHGSLGKYGVRSMMESSGLRILVPPKKWPRAPMVFVEEVAAAVRLAEAEGITVVIDTPPCTTSSIPFYMVGASTGVLYVARRRVQDTRTHQDIRTQFDMLGARILGVVFNEG